MAGRLFPESFEGDAPKEFGIGANILKTRTFALDVARDLEQIDIGGSCIWAMAASSLTASIDIRINDQLRDPLTFQQGMFIRGVPFSRVYVSHDAQVGATITLFFAVEQDVRNIEIINPSTQFNNVNIGNISQDDSWFYNTLRKETFIGSATAYTDINARAAVQLWNPAASGKNLLCHDIMLMATVTAFTIPLHFAHHNAALPTAGIQGNKWLTEAAGVGLVKYETNQVALVGTDIALLPIQPNIYIHIPLDKPVLIDPGTGLTLGIIQGDKYLTATFQWVEMDE